MIRPLVEEDIPEATDMIQTFCEEMGFPFDRASLANTMMASITHGWYLVIYEQDGEFIGMGGVAVYPHYADFSYLQGVEFVWHSVPTLSAMKRAQVMIELKKGMEQFCKERGIPLILNLNSEGKSGGLYGYLIKDGYTEKEVSLVKGVQGWEQ